MFKIYMDKIFKALYGEDTDEYGEKYSSVYKWECKEFIRDFDNWKETIIKYHPPGINSDTITAMIIYFEQIHIGNDLDIDYEMLERISNELL